MESVSEILMMMRVRMDYNDDERYVELTVMMKIKVLSSNDDDGVIVCTVG